MVASVLVREYNGPSSSEVATDKTSGEIRFKAADDATVDLNDPVVIPGSGQEHSMEKYIRMRIGGTGPDTQITSLTFYTDGANGYGTGVNAYYDTEASYITPVIPSNANTIPQHAATPMVTIFGLTSGAPLSLGAGPFSSINADMGLYLLLVMTALSTASPGVTASETLTFGYDEI